MRLRNLRVTISLLSLALIASAGNCAVDPPGAPRFPPKPVAGTWVGEVIGVRFRLSITEGAVDNYLNATYLEGAGWLIYGTPAESLAVTLIGGNVGGSTPGVGFELQRPGGSGGVYGNYDAVLGADGALLGPFKRAPDLEPLPSPWTDVWPAGASAVSLRLVRQ